MSYFVMKNQKLFSKIRNKKWLCVDTTVTQHCTGQIGQICCTRKRNRKHPKGKEEIKLSLFIDDMIICIESLIEFISMLLINSAKFQGTSFSMLCLFVFL